MEIYRGSKAGIADPDVPDEYVGGSIHYLAGERSGPSGIIRIERGAPTEDWFVTAGNRWYDVTSDSVWSDFNTVQSVEPGVIPLPEYATQYCGPLHLSYFAYNSNNPVKGEVHEVVQPLFTKEELVAHDRLFSKLSPAAFESLERMVRKIVEAYTAQKFELSRGTVTGRSHKPDSIVLPKRLVSADTLVIDGVHGYVDSDGWMIRADGAGQVDNRFDIFYNKHTWSGNIRISGIFGYQSVPTAVKTAALILAGDYGCEETSWRDQYVANMKNSDWRVEYNERTWMGTGNVKADQLLGKYRQWQVAVI